MYKEVKYTTALNAVTATTTSDPISIEGAKKVILELTRANHSAGSSAFKVQVSWDGVTYTDFAGLIDNIINSNAQTITRVVTKTLSSDITAYVAMDLEYLWFKWIKVVVTETTDGTHTAKVAVQF